MEREFLPSHGRYEATKSSQNATLYRSLLFLRMEWRAGLADQAKGTALAILDCLLGELRRRSSVSSSCT